MRETVARQLPLAPAPIDHEHAAELAEISRLLDGCSAVMELVRGDLTDDGRISNVGRRGMSAEQVLRVAVLKQMHGFSYTQLAFHLLDSRTFRTFCRLGAIDATPSRSTLQSNVKRLKAVTLEAVNRLVVAHAKESGVESGARVRVDCTVTASDVSPPSDSNMLWDAVRVLQRLMQRASALSRTTFRNRTRRAKRRSYEIRCAKTKAQRRRLYRDLLEAVDDTVSDACAVAFALEQLEGPESMVASAGHLASRLRSMIGRARRVWEQTHRRVFFEEPVPASEKLLSVFEEHTDLIVKDRREALYGHKLCLTTGASNLVLDCRVLRGNPADSTLAAEMVRRQRDVLGDVPQEVAFDGGFASRDNLTQIKAEGVQEVAFSKKRGLEVSEMVSEPAIYKALRNFRAGVEANISFLKRGFGLTRCTWKGFASFASYVWTSIVSANLLMLARHRLAAAR